MWARRSHGHRSTGPWNKCLGWEITSPELQVLDNCATASQVANVLDNFSIELVYHESSIPGAEQFWDWAGHYSPCARIFGA